PAAAWLARALARRRVRRIGVLVPDDQAAGTRSAIADHGARDLRSEVRTIDDVAPESWTQGLRGLSDALERRPAVLFWLPQPAGVGSGVLLQQETARFVARFRELVAPASALLAAARAQAIERVVLLSCDGAVPGSPGRGAETAAAAFVEGLARGAPEVGRVAVVSAALEVDDGARASAHADVAVWRRLGIAAPAPADVLHALQEAATSDPAFVSLLAIDWPRHARAVYGGVVPALLSCVIAGAPTAAAAQAGHLAARLAQAAPSQRMDVALGYLQELLADVLEDMPLEVDADRGLFELGLDSLGLLQLKTRLQLALDRAIPVTAAFNHPTPRALARHLIEDVCGHGVCGRSPGERTRAAEPALPSMLDEIEALSDEEAASLLREALA
ncbi:ketoreductase and phosphopantetheine attachment site domain-containing protein, partial [Candidatus Binatia bacterium]|nr:ketoreductase and phosphopantetheine attachment site domain-containing protein [Candidatus Binatia bacterium]